jgi:hypothetical protein
MEKELATVRAENNQLRQQLLAITLQQAAAGSAATPSHSTHSATQSLPTPVAASSFASVDNHSQLNNYFSAPSHTSAAAAAISAISAPPQRLNLTTPSRSTTGGSTASTQLKLAFTRPTQSVVALNASSTPGAAPGPATIAQTLSLSSFSNNNATPSANVLQHAETSFSQ